MPWRRKWQPTLVFLPAKFHIQRSLAGYSPWGCKESDMTGHARAWPELPFYLGGMMEWGNGDGAVGMVRKKTDVPSLPGIVGKAKWERISLSDSSPTMTTCCEGNVNTKTVHNTLFLENLYAEYIMWNAGLDESQAGIKIPRRNNNNLRYADDTTLMAESE